MTSPVSMPAGHAILAADLDAYENLTGAWTSWTPVWASFGTQPVLGNGTLTGKHTRVGKFDVFTVELIIGSTTTFGTNLYTMSTPTNVATGSTCGAFLEDNSTGFRYRGTTTIDTPANMNRILFGDGTAGWTGASPFTLATSDVIRIAGVYETT